MSGGCIVPSAPIGLVLSKGLALLPYLFLLRSSYSRWSNSLVKEQILLFSYTNAQALLARTETTR
ncbi:hypothetical protein GYMC10_3501 [Paenibacillus sp. Y412MC10]|nr:hypothetical protein GYMC10_3501 [Paenibacillus sp. Y412MC10]